MHLLPKCLLITQSVPAKTGHGASIRVGLTLEALSYKFSVTLLIVTQNPHINRAALTTEMETLCEAIHFVSSESPNGKRSGGWFQPRMMANWNISILSNSLKTLHQQHFDVIHVFRLGLVPIWQHLKNVLEVSAGQVVLDLDDIESRAHFRQVWQQGLACGRLGIIRELAEGLKLRQAENRVASQIDRLLVCSEDDRQLLTQRIDPAKLRVVPNGARFPELLQRREIDEKTRLLFLGSLFYGPNQHAVRWLLSEILPVIKKHHDKRVELVIVGRRPPEWLPKLAQSSGAELYADVPSVAPFYEATDVVVVPIKSGGGTRIKIIEAFGFGRPVISTRIGAEGLAVSDGDELLFAENPDEFTEALTRLSKDMALYAHITNKARQLANELYSPDAFAKSLLSAYTI